MPGEVLDRPNPPPGKSQLPDSILEYHVNLKFTTALTSEELQAITKFRRAADYIAAAMIFLKDNVLLEREIKPDDIKPRLLGHWGTCPGLVLTYAHLNMLIRKENEKMIFVVGPGHGAPAILATLWIEGSLAKFFPQYSLDRAGLENLIAGFSTPSGFPSHINAEVPGSIHEGGELGYALAVAFGAVMDKPELIVPVIIGDGEAETGPTAAAWHAAKYIDPKESGAVLPIVHVNGFKISERTIYGCMDDKEMTALFTGYGYQVRIVGNDLANIDQDMAASLQWALGVIRSIQKAAREGKPIFKPRWPVIILRTPKGMGAPTKYKGEFIEGSFRAHQVPVPDAKTDGEGLKILQEWLSSYSPAELFTEKGRPVDEVLSVVPQDKEKRLGQVKETHAGREPIVVPGWKELAVAKGGEESCMRLVGKYMDKVFLANPTSTRIFSPDELESNKLAAVFGNTGRNFQWDEYSFGQGGRVVEILSEHTCQGMLQGYTMTGRTALFPSYEAFIGIAQTMMVQYAKFVKMAKETNFRAPNASLNYLETSTWTRQEHNGFSHQNPSFIGAVLNLKADAARVYLPPDANCFLSTIAHCINSKNYVNLMVGSKQPTAVWLSPEEADIHCRAGASVWRFCSTDEGLRPDVVLVGIGTEVTFEVIAAAALLRTLAPELRVRVVNVTDLMVLGPFGSHPHALSDTDFENLFTKDKKIVVNYHGYVHDVAGLVFGRKGAERMHIEGYREEGSTTTPFDMMLRNHVSRYHVAGEAVRGAALFNERIALRSMELGGELQGRIKRDQKYIFEYGADPAGTYDVPTFN
ncbi:D-xylulose 5-phosphate/D-fructose 6-phosphate phosphoketolase [Thelephora ganbajun]|uniref:D-xylulose 5-phosphate/D-fructose 6-phosphate phosphoketolase n=1 Tax=Thelephora ganbajun TaxID=370292 RepID=A0ACB6ZIR6_THEGA|nr:D-xylulose 5-phosphate/D-fructose 6-phosphate phosphoketolase [Thelephora ganbajun]